MREPIEFHRMLLKAEERMTAYRDAIFAAVRPGDVVLDVGTGSGILSFFACQAGAARVYAVERSNAIILAQKLAAANGFDDRITFLRENAFEFDLPEQVDVIVSELVSKAVTGQKMAETIGHCRDRFLKPGGRIVPAQVSLHVAPVALPKVYARYAFPQAAGYGIDFSPGTDWALNQTTSANVPAAALLTPGQVAYVYDASNAPLEDRIRAQLIFEPQRAGELHGYCAWFSARLAADEQGEDVPLSNHPPGIGAWDNLFFPLSQPVAVETGTKIELDLKGNDTRQIPLFWAWQTCIERADDAGEAMVRYSQSTLQGQLLSAAGWKKRARDFVPDLSETGQVDALVLARMGEGMSIGAIANELQSAFPLHYADHGAALQHVAELSERYSL